MLPLPSQESALPSTCPLPVIHPQRRNQPNGSGGGRALEGEATGSNTLRTECVCTPAVVCRSSWLCLGPGIHSFMPLLTEPSSMPDMALSAGHARASHMPAVPSSWRKADTWQAYTYITAHRVRMGKEGARCTGSRLQGEEPQLGWPGKLPGEVMIPLNGKEELRGSGQWAEQRKQHVQRPWVGRRGEYFRN